MPPSPSFTLFLVASLVLLVVPGPAVLYIVARSIDRGAAAGIVSALGIAIGSVVLVFAAALGVSALLAASPVAFDAVRYTGAAYLVFLGVRAWRAGDDDVVSAPKHAASLRRMFAEGIVVNFLNPKTAIFFLAFLPQFVDPAGSIRLQLIILGLIFVAMGMITDSVYALVAGSVAARLRGSTRFPRVRRVVVPAIYVGLGVIAAFVHPTK